MSDKQWYKLIFKQVQPIHLGYRNYGVVNKTRIFIPGWTMWGALTKAYGIAHGWKNSDWVSESNQKIFENISCFYPALKNGNNFEILFPKFQDGEFYLGEYSEDEFRAKFVDTFVSTAINPLSNTALDESLHELNVILAGAKIDFIEKKNEKQLYWVGITKIENNLKDFLQEGLKILIGADVRYGYGEVELVECKPMEENEKDFWWIDNSNIKIKINKPSPYFIEAKENLEIEGGILLIPEIDFRENIPKLTDEIFFVSIGSKVKNHPENLELSKGKLIIKENQNANST